MSCRWSKYTLQGGIKTKTELVSTKIRKELEEQGGKEEQNIQGIGDKSREDSVVTSKRNRHTTNQAETSGIKKHGNMSVRLWTLDH